MKTRKTPNPDGICYTDWAVGEIDAFADRHEAGESIRKLAAEKGVTHVTMRVAITQVSARKRLTDNEKTAWSKCDNLGHEMVSRPMYCIRVGAVADENGWMEAPSKPTWWIGNDTNGTMIEAESRIKAKRIYESRHKGVKWCTSFS